MMRRAVAGGVGFIVLLLLFLAIRGCLNARKEQAYKDYVQEVAGIVRDSDKEGDTLFGVLNARGGRDQAVDIENSLNAVRVDSAEVVDRAKKADHPDELNGAQSALVEALELRRDAVRSVADALPQALSDQNRKEGTKTITEQMQSFLASDVVYARRFVPRLHDQLKKEDLADEVGIPPSQFLPTIAWLDPGFVSQRVSGIRTGKSGQAAAPGLHGNGLGTVTLAGQALTPGGAATIKLAGDLKLQVQIANQGENTETDVPVRVTIGKGGDAVEAEGKVDSIGAGETKTVEVPITEDPPTGRSVPIDVEVEAVPGEKKTDNNKQSFSAIFTR